MLPTGGLSPSRMISRLWLPPPIGFGTAAMIVPSCVRLPPTAVGEGDGVAVLVGVDAPTSVGVTVGVGVAAGGAAEDLELGDRDEVVRAARRAEDADAVADHVVERERVGSAVVHAVVARG